MPETKRRLKVFLCHASADKPKVRELYRYLRRRGVMPWFDEKDLVPGQDWQIEIPKALSTSDAIIICLTKNSVPKEGYVQTEIKFALDKALEMPEGRIFLIPVRFEECEVPFALRRYQWVDLFDEGGYTRMMRALKFRAAALERATVEVLRKETKEEQPTLERAQEENREREAAGKAAIEKAEREEAEKAKREKLEHEAAVRARSEEDEKKAAEKAAQEKAKREAAEKAKREKAERRATQIIALKGFISKFFTSFKRAAPKIKPFLRIVGILGIILALGWVGSEALAQLPLTLPTAEASIRARPTSTFALSGSPTAFTKTVIARPVTHTATPTKTYTPAPSKTMGCTSATGITTAFVWLRTGPGEYYRALATYEKGVTVTILGKSTDGKWLVVLLSDGKQGWVSSASIQINVSGCNLPIATAPPTQTPLPTLDVHSNNPCNIARRSLQRWQAAYGSSSGDPNYDAGVDFNGDGAISGSDYVLLINRWPDDCPAP
jgi:uncharacterized protein YraI